MNQLATTDLCDAHEEHVEVCEPVFHDYGGESNFSGPITTLKTFEDNTKVRELLETKGEGKVLVVDGGGSTRCALVGGNLAKLAEENGWKGILVYGCVRDRDELEDAKVGIKAIGHVPRKSKKANRGDINQPVKFAGVTFLPGYYLYADRDGVIISKKPLN